MEKIILSYLNEIESKYEIEILLACETGSRAWGFPSPDSDYDVRIIYKHNVDWYLSLSEKKDYIEWMAEGNILDITGWDLRKTLRLLYKSNVSILERIQSPIIYKHNEEFLSQINELAQSCFSPIATFYHYFGLAKNTFSDLDGCKELKLKKLFYALRATLACNWIIQKDSIPPISFITMVNELAFDENIRAEIKNLITLKLTKDESYIHQADENMLQFIRENLNAASADAARLTGAKNKQTDLDRFFKNWIK